MRGALPGNYVFPGVVASQQQVPAARIGAPEMERRGCHDLLILALTPTPTPGRPVWNLSGKRIRQENIFGKSIGHLVIHTWYLV